MTGENKELLRAKGWREVIKKLRVPLLMLPLLVNETRAAVAQRIQYVQPFPHIRETLQQLHASGHIQGLVTSNSTTAVTAFVHQHRLEYFVSIRGDSSLFGKASKIKKLMKAHHMAHKETVYVGDEIRDIEAARSAGVRIISVTWGANSRAALETHHPDFLVDTPLEIVQICNS